MASAAPMERPHVESVRVTFDGVQLHISPDPKNVTRGNRVVWYVQDDSGETGRWRWTLYFHHGSPFREGWEFSVTTTSGEIGTVNPGQALEPGEWKYGIRVANNDTRDVRDDEDPYLIVHA
jgi:hypothetical protein